MVKKSGRIDGTNEKGLSKKLGELLNLLPSLRWSDFLWLVLRHQYMMLRQAFRSIARSRSRFPGVRAFHSTPVAFEGGAIFQHRQSEDNNEHTPFDFSIENYQKVKTILGRYPKNYKASGIIPLLDLGQRQNGNFCSLSVMNKVAAICEVRAACPLTPQIVTVTKNRICLVELLLS